MRSQLRHDLAFNFGVDLTIAAGNAFDEAGGLKEALPAQILGMTVARVIELAEKLQPPTA